MANTRRTRFAAGAAVAALALAGCAAQTDTESEGDGEEGNGGGSITVAETNAFTSFNTIMDTTNLDVNSKVLYTMRSDFYYVDPDMQLVKDESFGTYEKTSDDPLTMEYNVNDDVVWSDGNAVDKADLLLEWAIQAGYFWTPGEDGAETPMFAYAGSTEGMGMTSLPEFSDDNSFTIVYDKPFVDWEIGFTMANAQPAHVIAERAGMTEDELIDVIESYKEGDESKPMRKVAEVWAKDFTMKTLGDDPSLYLSNGPMIPIDAVEDQSITLGLNDKYAGDLNPKVDEITVRFIGEATGMVSALKNGEVNIIAPQPEADTLEAVNNLDNVEVQDGPQLAYDHLDLAFDSEVFADKDVREAFLKTIPRDTAVDRLQKPLYADASVLNSQVFVTSQGEPYEQAVAANGSDAYAEVDIEGAKELLDGRTPTVKILYNSANPVRVNTFALIQESAGKAGFVVEDMGDPNWSAKLTDKSYDASIFGWISPGVGNADIPQIFASTGGSNFRGYKSAEVDRLAKELAVAIDPDDATEVRVKVDAELFSDAYGLPLFQTPALQVFSDDVSGVEFMSNQTGVWWNYWEWSIS